MRSHPRCVGNVRGCAFLLPSVKLLVLFTEFAGDCFHLGTRYGRCYLLTSDIGRLPCGAVLVIVSEGALGTGTERCWPRCSEGDEGGFMESADYDGE